MALIETQKASNSYVDGIPDLMVSLRLAVVEELAAVNTYKILAQGIARCGTAEFDSEGKKIEVPDTMLTTTEAKAIAAEIEEIADDEITHVGKLMELMNKIDPAFKAQLAKGAAEA